MDDSTTKFCPKCGQDKPRSDFHKNRKRTDGLASWCKVCFGVLDKTRSKTPERRKIQADSKRARYAPIKAANEQTRARAKAQLRSAPVKVCRQCAIEQPIAAFTTDDRYQDGRYPWCAACRQGWRQQRKSRTRELNRRWAAIHRDRVHEMASQHYARHKDKIAPKRRERDRRRWHTDAAYRKRKNVQTAAKNRRRRALLYGAPTEHHTEQEWQQVCEKYDHRCLRCGEQVPLTRDHVVPVTLSGSDAITNIQPLCRSCNSWKNNRTIDFRPEWG